MRKRFFYSVLPLFLCNACAVGPDYERPEMRIPPNFKETSPDWKVAEPKDSEPCGKWWEKFHDLKLNELEGQLETANQTIANAEANYRQARALVEKARAAYFPTLSFNADVLRSKSASNTTSATSSSSGGRIITSQSMSLDASWEPDLWGLVRRTVESAEDTAESSRALWAVTRLSESALLAQTYFELQNLDADQKLLDDTVKSNRHILKIAQHQYDSGVVNRSDVIQAEATLETSEAAALNNHIARAQYEHAIAVLVGKAPADFALAFHPLTTKPAEVILDFPSTVLERRPDVAEAERAMAAANAEIGVAIAAYFPVLTISATGGYSGINLSHWINEPSQFWSIGPSLAQILFDGGAISATVEGNRAAYDASVANYKQTVLAAFQDVEDNLVSLRVLAAESKKLHEAAKKQEVALNLILNQYKSGVVAYSSVLTAQLTLYAAQKSAIDAEGLRMTSSVGLLKALGGDWQG